MREAFKDLLAFEKACGHEASTDCPELPLYETYCLRRSLIREEFEELMSAMGHGDLPEIADGLADLVYVILGTAVRYGIDLPAIWRAVHEANMTKVGPSSTRDVLGKIQKPPGFKHPDIAALLAKQKPLAEIYRDYWDTIE